MTAQLGFLSLVIGGQSPFKPQCHSRGFYGFSWKNGEDWVVYQKYDVLIHNRNRYSAFNETNGKRKVRVMLSFSDVEGFFCVRDLAEFSRAVRTQPQLPEERTVVIK